MRWRVSLGEGECRSDCEVSDSVLDPVADLISPVDTACDSVSFGFLVQF